MAELDSYEGTGECYADGRLFAEAKSVRVTVSTNDREVNTMKKGLAGFSRGPTKSEIALSNAVPKSGYAVDYLEELVLARKTVRVVVVHAGKRRTHVGRFTSYESSNSTEDSAEANLNFTGKPQGSI